METTHFWKQDTVFRVTRPIVWEGEKSGIDRYFSPTKQVEVISPEAMATRFDRAEQELEHRAE